MQHLNIAAERTQESAGKLSDKVAGSANELAADWNQHLA